MSLELEDRTGRVIGAAIEVHRTLGPGFLETVYERALAVELARRGISFVRQLNVPIRYQGQTSGHTGEAKWTYRALWVATLCHARHDHSREEIAARSWSQSVATSRPAMSGGLQGVEVGEHVLDLLVDDQIVVELKAARRLEDIHFVILRSYLKATDREHGLLLNFAGTSLEIKRVFSRTAEDASRLPGFLGSRVQPPA